MDGRGDQAEHDRVFGNHRVHHNRTEDAVILAQIEREVGRFAKAAVQKHRRHAGVGHTKIKPFGAKSLLQRRGHLPQVLFMLRLATQHFETLARAHHEGHRQRLGKRL